MLENYKITKQKENVRRIKESICPKVGNSIVRGFGLDWIILNISKTFYDRLQHRLTHRQLSYTNTRPFRAVNKMYCFIDKM